MKYTIFYDEVYVEGKRGFIFDKYDIAERINEQSEPLVVFESDNLDLAKATLRRLPTDVYWDYKDKWMYGLTTLVDENGEDIEYGRFDLSRFYKEYYHAIGNLKKIINAVPFRAALSDDVSQNLAILEESLKLMKDNPKIDSVYPDSDIIVGLLELFEYWKENKFGDFDIDEEEELDLRRFLDGVYNSFYEGHPSRMKEGEDYIIN